MADGLNREQAKELVRAASKPRASKPAKGRGVAKGKAKLPTERTLRTSDGVKVIAQARKGLDIDAWIEALEDATRQAQSMREPQGEQTAA
jgi:hypothetical protein